MSFEGVSLDGPETEDLMAIDSCWFKVVPQLVRVFVRVSGMVGIAAC
jgi:hypothetical protein